MFLGFRGPAPPLSSRDPQFTQGSNAFYPIYSFVVEFYTYALAYYSIGYDINVALDKASRVVWHKNHFDDTVLWNGYFIKDPETDVYEFGRMVVYGNGDLSIY